MTDEILITCLRLALAAIERIETPDHNDVIDLYQALVDAKVLARDALTLRSDREAPEVDANE